MTVFGPSLSALFKKCRKRFTVPTQVRLGIQILYGLKQLHEVSWLLYYYNYKCIPCTHKSVYCTTLLNLRFSPATSTVTSNRRTWRSAVEGVRLGLFIFSTLVSPESSSSGTVMEKRSFVVPEKTVCSEVPPSTVLWRLMRGLNKDGPMICGKWKTYYYADRILICFVTM